MKKHSLIPVLALMLATTLALPSCKDDDEPKDNGTDHTGTEEEGEAIEGAEANAKALKFWDVASQLVGTSAYTTDYADATFEPTIGTLEGNTSIVLVNDMQAAAQKFANLTGADIDEETDTYTYNDPEVGTLTYTKVNDGTTWATVTVSIKQIPHLEKIIFRNSTDDNGSFGEQKAWYRFGDVVKRNNAGGEPEYWICVRPAFTYEKKEDSHWVCVSKLSSANTYSYTYKANNTNYYLPTKVGTDKENMQNFAEMLYAICYPQEWYDNCLNHHTDKLIGYSGMPIFSDFHAKYIKYHNQYFWQNVQEAWKNTPDIQNTALNLGLDVISQIIKTDGINLLYNGYSWWTTKGNCSLYNASYTIGSADKEKNLHKADYQTINTKIYTFNVDCRTMGKDLLGYKQFFSDNKYRWVIRHATGKDLNNGIQPAATAEIQGVKEVYRYYSYYPAEKTRQGDNNGNGPEVSVASYEGPETPKVGLVIGSDKKFYKTIKDVESAGHKAVGLVVYVESNKKNGLAMALEDASKGNQWASTDNVLAECSVSVITEIDMLVNCKNANPGATDGLSLANGCNKNHTHDAAIAAKNYKAFDGDNTQWFLPSASDIVKVFSKFDLVYDDDFGTFVVKDAEDPSDLYTYFTALFTAAGTKYQSTHGIWTSTLNKVNDKLHPVIAQITTTGLYFDIPTAGPTDDSFAVRPFMEF